MSASSFTPPMVNGGRSSATTSTLSRALVACTHANTLQMYLPTFAPLGAEDPSCAPACIPPVGDGPALAPSANRPTGVISQQAQNTPAADASVTALISHRNTLGVALAALLIVATFALWLAFGKWPRKQWRALGHRLQRRMARRARNQALRALKRREGAGHAVPDMRATDVQRADDSKHTCIADGTTPAEVVEEGLVVIPTHKGGEGSNGSEESLVGTYVRMDLC